MTGMTAQERLAYGMQHHEGERNAMAEELYLLRTVRLHAISVVNDAAAVDSLAELKPALDRLRDALFPLDSR